MATIKLEDSEAFILMLKLIFRTFLNCNDRNLIKFAFKFCRLDDKLIDCNELMKQIKCLSRKRVNFFYERKYLKVNLDFKSSEQSNYSLEDKHHFKIAFKFGTLNLSFKIKNDQKRSVHLPIKISNINSKPLRIKIIDVTSQHLLSNINVDLNQISLLEGFNLNLAYDYSKKQFTKAVLEQDTNRYPKIDFNFTWFQFNTDSFDETDVKLKDQLAKHHQLYLDQHLKLLKYVFVRKFDCKPIRGSIIDGNFLDKELTAILDQNLFEGALKRVDHLVCIQKIVKELQADEAYRKVDFRKSIDKEGLIKEIDKQDASYSTESSSKDDISFIFRPFDNLNVELPTDLPFKLIEPVHSDDLSNKNLNKQRYEFKEPFDFNKMKFRYLNDFDANSDKV